MDTMRTHINDVNKDNQSFVVSPNMSKHIVALQEGLEDIARTFPATFVLHKWMLMRSTKKQCRYFRDIQVKYW